MLLLVAGQSDLYTTLVLQQAPADSHEWGQCLGQDPGAG